MTAPLLDAESSERLTALRFPLIVGVVFIHAYESVVRLSTGTLGVAHDGGWSLFIRDLVSSCIASVAVPLFYLVSGFLLFCGARWTLQDYAERLRSRLRTLLVPYLAWNIMAFACIAIAQAWPVSARFFSSSTTPVLAMPWIDMLDTVLGITHPPIAYQFWFIKDLMVLVLLAPLLAACVHLAGPLAVSSLVLLWLVDPLPSFSLDVEALCFFAVGAFLGNRSLTPFVLDRWGSAMMLTYVPVVLVDAWTRHASYNPPVHKLGILIGLPLALYLSRHLVRTSMRVPLLALGTASFFVFAGHEPLLTIVRKLLYRAWLPATDTAVLLLYVIAPAMVIALTLLVYVAMRRLSPRLLAILSGGRT